MGKQGKRKGTTPRVGDRPFRQVDLRVFVHATEREDRVRDALGFVSGLDLGGEEVRARFEKRVDRTVSQGHFRNPITIFQLTLNRVAEVRGFWKRVLGEERVRRELAQHAQDRLDEDLVFWFRLDKQEAAAGRLRLGGEQDVVLVRAKLATYPKDRETGLSFLREFFDTERPESLL